MDYWLADLDLENRIAPLTRRGYEDGMRKLALPAFQHLTLREIGVARCDALLKQLGRLSYARSERAKTVLRLACGLAVRHEVIPRNPIDGVARLHEPKRTQTALTATEINAIRAVIKVWERTRGTSGRNPDGQLGQIVEVMLGTSARIGEVLGIRRCDVDVTTRPPRCGSAGRSHGARRRHLPPVPSQDRPLQPDRCLADVHGGSTPATARGRGRPVTGCAGIPKPRRHAAVDRERTARTPEGAGAGRYHRSPPAHVPPHCGDGYQRTSERESRRRAPRPTIEHYIRRNEQVNLLTAELLDAAFAAERQDDESEPA